MWKVTEILLKECTYVTIENITQPDNEKEYIIYVRKSTDEQWKQIQSIEDQLRLCKEYAEKNNIKIQKRDNSFETDLEKLDWFTEINSKDLLDFANKYFVIIEKKSAKTAYKRPKRRKIIEWIKQWKIKWILSYHPDRQARNLLEAGELIDLLDNKMVSLKYTSLYFEDTTTNKMILWVLFVLAKHYSDKLSDDVTRWIISQLIKWQRKWVHKFGYYIDKNGFYRPDPLYFEIVKEAFNMRLRWEPIKNIKEYLLKHNLKKRKETPEWKMIYLKDSWFKVDTILKDTFYCWLYKYSDKEWNNYFIDLRIIPWIDFERMISEEQFYKINPEKMYWKDSNKKGNNIFSHKFFITEDNMNCSSYYTSKWTKSWEKYINKWWKLGLDDWIDEIKVHFRIPKKSKIYKLRQEKDKKNDFSLKELENHIILPALSLLDIDKLYNYIEKIYKSEIFKHIINEKNKKIEALRLNKNKFIHKIKELRESLNNSNLPEEEKNKTNQKIKLYQESIHLIDKNIVEEEILWGKKLLSYEDFLNNMKKLLSNYPKLKVKSKKLVLENIFEKLIVTEEWIWIFCKKNFTPFFKNKIQDNLIIFKDIPKKQNKKK